MTTTYKVKKHFEYTLKGQLQSCEFIELLEPTGRHIAEVAPVKKALMQCLVKLSTDESIPDKTEEAKDRMDEDDADMLMAMLEVHYEGDLTPVIMCVTSMLTAGKLGLIDGEEPLKKKHIEELSIEDTYGLVGAFMVAFMQPSQ